MNDRVADAAAAHDAFITLAEAEGSRIPTYARFCRIIARHPDLHGLLLEAPIGQRLPVLVLAALHDVVLRHPDCPLAPWYPSVTGTDPSREDPEAALVETCRSHRDEIVGLIRTRQVQTNEVNRSCAWWWGASQLCSGDDRPLFVVEVGASAGLNLRFEEYSYRFDDEQDAADVGRRGSPVRLGTTVVHAAGGSRTPVRPRLPPVVGRVGIDRNPLDPTDAEDRRWLAACVWPEQRLRYERMSAALSVAASAPPRVVRGDLVDDLGTVLAEAPDDSHVVVLASWVLVYLERDRRSGFASTLAAASVPMAGRGTRVSLLTLEADHVLPWMERPHLEPDASADRRHASILAATDFGAGRPVATPLARCQAHLVWLEPLGPVASD
jgi:hypothetical protein